MPIPLGGKLPLSLFEYELDNVRVVVHLSIARERLIPLMVGKPFTEPCPPVRLRYTLLQEVASELSYRHRSSQAVACSNS